MKKIIFTILIGLQIMAFKVYSQTETEDYIYDGWRFQISLGSVFANEIEYMLENPDKTGFRGMTRFKEEYIPALGLGFSYRSENGLEMGLELNSFDQELEKTLLTKYSDLIYLAGERHILLLMTNFTQNYANDSPVTPYFSFSAGVSKISPMMRLEVSDWEVLEDEIFWFEQEPNYTYSGSFGFGVDLKITAVNLGLFYDYLFFGVQQANIESELSDVIMQNSKLPNAIELRNSTNHRVGLRASFPLYD